MDFITGLAGGGIGSIIGAIGGIASGFLKFKTLKESNRHSFVMSELAGSQEVERAVAALKMVEVEGAIKTDLAIEESLQSSFKHDASLGAWMQGRELGWFGTAVMSVAEFVRMMMRPALSIPSVWYVFAIYGDYLVLAAGTEMSPAVIAEQITMVSSTILLLATTSFTWWFADRSVSKALVKKLL